MRATRSSPRRSSRWNATRLWRRCRRWISNEARSTGEDWVAQPARKSPSRAGRRVRVRVEVIRLIIMLMPAQRMAVCSPGSSVHKLALAVAVMGRVCGDLGRPWQRHSSLDLEAVAPFCRAREARRRADDGRRAEERTAAPLPRIIKAQVQVPYTRWHRHSLMGTTKPLTAPFFHVTDY